VSTDPLGLTEDVQRSTARLLATAGTLDDEALAGPSLLPGWTRGHVLTHLARNTDGAVNLLIWARTGVETPQYASLEQRAADIEAGAGRDAATQLADLRAACDRLTEAIDAMPAEAWSNTIRWIHGREAPAAEVMWRRMRELEIHHVDLAAGYTAADWPDSFNQRLARELARDFTARADGIRVVVRSPEVGHDLIFGDATTEPVVSGPLWATVAWLTGRSAGGGLGVSPPGPLPYVPPLG
jgi:maleylpyruvate isomerase